MSAKLICVTLAAMATVALASPCNEASNDRTACESLGCKWNGNNNCGQPDYCKTDDERRLRYGGMLKRNKELETFAVQRPPMSPEQASLCTNHPECTAMYRITLSPTYTSGAPNCNDLGMLPPHGRNQTDCKTENDVANNLIYNGLTEKEVKFWEKVGGLENYHKHPFPNNGIKQSVAKGANAETALMEESSNCFDARGHRDWGGIWGSSGQAPAPNDNCAFPLGFMSDTIVKNKAICVTVEGAEGRWVEIMASSRTGSDGGSFCVSDWGPEGEEQACTKEGDLYECREAGRSQSGNAKHEMKVKFQAFDNIDDAQMEIYWRIVASKLPEGTTGDNDNTEKDAEDWCQYRDAADFPMSLMGAYPLEFGGNPVFDIDTSSANRLVPGAAMLLTVVGTLLTALAW